MAKEPTTDPTGTPEEPSAGGTPDTPAALEGAAKTAGADNTGEPSEGGGGAKAEATDGAVDTGEPSKGGGSAKAEATDGAADTGELSEGGGGAKAEVTDGAAEATDGAAEATDGAADTGEPSTFLIVHDKEGVVGAFESVAAASAALAPYAGLSFVFTRWPGAGPDVWTLPYRDIDVVAFASTDRAAVVATQKVLVPVGHVYPDDVDYWQVKMNEIVGPAEKRLKAFADSLAEARTSADALREGKTIEDEATATFLDFAKGLPEKLDESRINIFEGLVTVPLGSGGGEKSPAAPSGGM